MPRGDSQISDDLKKQVKERLKTGLSDAGDDDRAALPEPDTSGPTVFGKVSLEYVALFLRELSVLLKAGFPLLRALNLLGKSQTTPRLSKAIRAVATEVEEGGSFWKAASRHPGIFRPISVAIIRAGESSGTLEDALDYLADSTEYEAEVRGSVRNALTYPIFFAVLVLVALGVILLGVVPQFGEMYNAVTGSMDGSSSVEKSWIFSTLLALSAGFKGYFTAVILIGAGVIGGLWYVFASKKFMSAEKLKLRIPIFGRLMVLGDLTRLSNTLAVLLQTGVPILQALELVRGVADNLEMQSAVDEMYKSAERGGSLGEPLREFGVIPPLAVDMLIVGEESGSLQTSLEHLGKTLQNNIERLVARITSLIQPVLLVLMGTVVVVIFLALFIPYFDLLSQFRPGGSGGLKTMTKAEAVKLEAKQKKQRAIAKKRAAAKRRALARKRAADKAAAAKKAQAAKKAAAAGKPKTPPRPAVPPKKPPGKR